MNESIDRFLLQHAVRRSLRSARRFCVGRGPFAARATAAGTRTTTVHANRGVLFFVPLVISLTLSLPVAVSIPVSVSLRVSVVVTAAVSSAGTAAGAAPRPASCASRLHRGATLPRRAMTREGRLQRKRLCLPALRCFPRGEIWSAAAIRVRLSYTPELPILSCCMSEE